SSSAGGSGDDSSTPPRPTPARHLQP
ncbi:hypothetical protein EE612_030554, partial [Oryza sativa]